MVKHKMATFSLNNEILNKLDEMSTQTNIKKSAIVAMLVANSDVNTILNMLKKETTNG